jgi:hypothetical protein
MSVLRTYEHGDDVITVHAYRSVTDGWRVGLAVVTGRRDHETTARAISPDPERSFTTADAAARAAHRLVKRSLRAGS